MDIGTKVGPYEINQLIGQGGMAEVYKAWNIGLHRYEALKLLPPQMTYDRSFVERFLAEARTAASLQHIHIATIHTVSQPTEQQSYFTMELVEGGDLASHICHLGCFSVSEALPILRQIGQALDYAHAHGIIHRDVKPANVLLQQNGQGGWIVKVVDFGIARAQEAGDGARLTKTGMIIGTPEYMSPEQGGSGGKVDHRTDVYSLGIIAYEMLCGHPPFVAGAEGSAISVIMAHIRDSPPPLLEQIPQIPSVINDAILRALAKDPALRFDSCAGFVNAFTGAVTTNRLNMPVVQANEPVIYNQASLAKWPVKWGLYAAITAVMLGISMIALSVARNLFSNNSASVSAKSSYQSQAIAVLKQVTVPQLVGQTEEQARATAAASSLTVNVMTDHSASIPSGSVIHQSLPPSSSVQPASKIDILVSTGPSQSPSPTNGTPIIRSSSMQTTSRTAAAPSTITSAEDMSEIRSRYNEWLQAWHEMNLSTYMSFYSLSVIERRAGKPAYGYSEMHRKLADNWAKQSYITVDGPTPDINLQGDTAVVSASQRYDSTTWWDQGMKRMIWARENGAWVIREEMFTKQSGGSKG